MWGSAGKALLVRSREERGREWLWGIVTADHANVSCCQVVYVLGWERLVPGSKGAEVKCEIRLYTITSSLFGKGKEQSSNQQRFNNQYTL